MKADIRVTDESSEFETDEGCRIIEISNDDGDEALSISRARVLPGRTTQWHQLRNTDERYVIVSGQGYVEVGEELATEVKAGDVVRIPHDIPQRIRNVGRDDLIFYCLCTPPFQPSCYLELSDLKGIEDGSR